MAQLPSVLPDECALAASVALRTITAGSCEGSSCVTNVCSDMTTLSFRFAQSTVTANPFEPCDDGAAEDFYFACCYSYVVDELGC